MVTYGGMSKKPVTVSTSSFIFKVSHDFPILVRLLHCVDFFSASVCTSLGRTIICF